ncbi:CubicO group peptidase (beta-lactamase class C family) [Catenuloplanes nepalensis]|uniref:CubicO group peptidase (Beta-lactamase class C family) n=1 Tax=Catenuloplanes nepalensis TaxID=587533 RepID=A0ABT9N921_9ACTN|nr:serine hydrolase domain-containing protein [Catenuloplanes nepalensis]MDP9799731.1 CubicO group peptidase (beta-lactamase class C family) [Catenuloplanes nepalensis]
MPVSRRTLVRSALLAGAAAGFGGCARPDASASPGRWVAPSAVSPSAVPSASSAAPPSPVPAGSAALEAVLTAHLTPNNDNPHHPGYAGAVALAWQDGLPLATATVGDALRYGAGPVELPAAERVPMRPDSIFDLASITKVFTAVLTLRLADAGTLDLDAPLSRFLPEFTAPGVTAAMLLTHTSGLPVSPSSPRGFLTTPPLAAPGTVFRYSGVGPMVLGRLIEKQTGMRLDRALREHVTGPLGLTGTGYLPLDWVSDVDRIAATDARTSRGLLRGRVHDDICDTLGGVTGHAGIFATAADVAVLGQLLLDGGTYRGTRVLSTSIVSRMLTNANAGLPLAPGERPGRTADYGLGVVMNQPWFMGALSSPGTFGHTGFSGTSLLVDPVRRLVVVLLTNRAHPNWNWAEPDPYRVAVHDAVAALV